MADDLLDEALDIFDLCVEAESENREAGLKDLEFARLADQWPEEIRKKRQREGRPCLTINRMPSFARQVVNEARQNQISIKVRPVDDNADIATAEVFNGLIRNIEQQSNAASAYDTAAESAVYLGFGYFRIAIEYAHDDSFDKELRIVRIPNALSVYRDPFSTAVDSSDWNHGFVTEWMARDEYLRRFPKADDVNWRGEDKNRATWADEDAVQIAEWWKREEVDRKILLMSDGSVVAEDVYKKQPELFEAIGVKPVRDRITKSYKITQRLMSGVEILEETAWAGCYIPIVPVYGDEINVEGKRILRSLIHDAKDAQQMLNFWRTASTELVALAPKAPWLMPENAFPEDPAEVEKWSTANTETHAYLTYRGQQAPERVPFAGIPAGALQEAMNAQDDMKSILGIYDAALGARSNETSGKAINARKQESDTATFHFVDNLARAVRHGGRILIDLIPKVYTGDRVVRILGQDGSVQNVRLGQKSQAQDNQTIDAQANAGPQEHKPGSKLNGIYDLSAGKYDMAVDVGPAYVTQRQEAADQMMQLIQSFPEAAPIIGDLVAKNLDWPGADQIAERLKALLPPQVNDSIPPQLMQQLQQLQAAVTELTAENQQLKEGHDIEREKMGVEREKISVDAAKVQAEALKAKAEAMKSLNEATSAEAVMQAAQQLMAAAQAINMVPSTLNAEMQALKAEVARPRVKKGRAVKLPDGSFEVESMEA